jgi:hypothetical protein
MEKVKVKLPVMKAWKRTFDLLDCINRHPFDRNGFQGAVLKLYPGKSSKSVFRGMAIPTLRNLGLILGFGDDIRISANGALINCAFSKSREEGIRALRAILFELDQQIEFISYLADKPSVVLDEFIQTWNNKIEISDLRTINNPQSKTRAAIERIRDWINFLTFAEMLYNDGKNIRIDPEKLRRTLADSAPNKQPKKQLFVDNFLLLYKKIVHDQNGITTVEIESLRKSLALCIFYLSDELLTEMQFDNLLIDFPKSTREYLITFGRSMGAEEKLFSYQGRYYQTLLVRFVSQQ